MPIYQYRCQFGHITELDRPMEKRHDPAVCETCDEDAQKVVSIPGVTWAGKFGNRDEQLKRGTW